MKIGKKQIHRQFFFILAFGAVVLLTCFRAGNTGNTENVENTGASEGIADGAELPHPLDADAGLEKGKAGGTKVDFEQLRAQNPDIYAWITVPGTGIDYPVLQKEMRKTLMTIIILTIRWICQKDFPE